MGRRLAATVACILAAGVAPGQADIQALRESGAQIRPVPFSELDGWAADDHAAALRVFRATCARAGRDGSFDRACRKAAALGDERGESARLFFEREFDPVEVLPAGSGRGFLTGYYEPEVAGSLEPDTTFRAPLLQRPDDLLSLDVGATKPPGWPEGYAAARRVGEGFEPYPDRAAIEAGALGDKAKPLLFVADPVDAFMIGVQGSARVRLPDGRVVRVGYAGRNGHPYTSIGRVLAEQEGVPPSAMTADRLVAWLKANPNRAPDIMRRNRSLVFFRLIDTLDPGEGPIGAAGLPLTPGRSLAVDAKLWPYGVPVWIEAELPRPGDGAAEPVRRLVVAQDTGTAIVGPARGDLFFGSGADAGARASGVRHPARWVALWPKPGP